jgi:uncharacterized protein YkwD
MITASAAFPWLTCRLAAAVTLLFMAPAQEKTTSAEGSKPALHAVEVQIVESTNAARARHGLPPLSIDPSLVRSARSHTIRMIRMRSLVHTTMAVAENIAKGQSTAREAVSDWMNSPGHRANILSRSHGKIGAAAYLAPDGMVYWCQQFLP